MRVPGIYIAELRRTEKYRHPLDQQVMTSSSNLTSSPHHLLTTLSRGTLQDVPHLARPSTHEDHDLSHAFVSLNFVTEEGTRARSASELEYTFEGPITPVKVSELGPISGPI